MSNLWAGESRVLKCMQIPTNPELVLDFFYLLHTLSSALKIRVLKTPTRAPQSHRKCLFKTHLLDLICFRLCLLLSNCVLCSRCY